MSSFEFTLNGELKAVELEKKGDRLVLSCDGQEFSLEPSGDNLFKIYTDGQTHYAAAAKHKGSIFVDIDSALFELKEPSEDGFAGGAAGAHGGEKDRIFAPMPGKIVKIMVAVGDEVEEKQAMVIVEAMKMENQVMSQAKGKVKAVNFAPGDQVDTDSPIIELEIE
ncbi:MAG TPA: biotin/lipoyl-containing protein [candidate division Zixibacteria bacterium]|nr:biotin/lipoyl-containing protein [candidate division Zixibacteria bacterium]